MTIVIRFPEESSQIRNACKTTFSPMSSFTFSNEDIAGLQSREQLLAYLKEKNVSVQKPLERVIYKQEMEKLQIELLKLQNWILKDKKRVAVIFEGRDAAGKGGAIRRFRRYLNPRSARVVALGKPSDTERGQWYFRRHVKELPNPGELVFFDRSWYNRAVVEPANGFCTEEEYERFMNEVNHFENMLIGDGIRLIKFYLSISREEQQQRIEGVREDPLRRWELTPVDLRALELWEQYTYYKTEMFRRTDGPLNPWIRIEANDKRKAHLEIIRCILERLPYQRS